MEILLNEGNRKKLSDNRIVRKEENLNTSLTFNPTVILVAVVMDSSLAAD